MLNQSSGKIYFHRFTFHCCIYFHIHFHRFTFRQKNIHIFKIYVFKVFKLKVVQRCVNFLHFLNFLNVQRGLDEFTQIWKTIRLTDELWSSASYKFFTEREKDLLASQEALRFRYITRQRASCTISYGNDGGDARRELIHESNMPRECPWRKKQEKKRNRSRYRLDAARFRVAKKRIVPLSRGKTFPPRGNQDVYSRGRLFESVCTFDEERMHNNQFLKPISTLTPRGTRNFCGVDNIGWIVLLG